MCGAEDDIRGADAIQISGANSQCRGEQGEAETDCKGPVEKGWEACASGYSFTLCSQSVSAQLNIHLVPDTQMPVYDGWVHLSKPDIRANLWIPPRRYQYQH